MPHLKLLLESKNTLDSAKPQKINNIKLYLQKGHKLCCDNPEC